MSPELSFSTFITVHALQVLAHRVDKLVREKAACKRLPDIDHLGFVLFVEYFNLMLDFGSNRVLP